MKPLVSYSNCYATPVGGRFHGGWGTNVDSVPTCWLSISIYNGFYQYRYVRKKKRTNVNVWRQNRGSNSGVLKRSLSTCSLRVVHCMFKKIKWVVQNCATSYLKENVRKKKRTNVNVWRQNRGSNSGVLKRSLSTCSLCVVHRMFRKIKWVVQKCATSYLKENILFPCSACRQGLSHTS